MDLIEFTSQYQRVKVALFRFMVQHFKNRYPNVYPQAGQTYKHYIKGVSKQGVELMVQAEETVGIRPVVNESYTLKVTWPELEVFYESDSIFIQKE